ncbi:MAG: hypothetical protein KQH57_17995 [Actinomycetales bacterium]|nr:hypothetical protein [Actinomycetales bacterium]
MADLQRARRAKSRLRAHLQDQAGVCGVGLVPHDGDWCVRVNVVREADREAVPREVAGVTVEVRVVGAVHPQR